MTTGPLTPFSARNRREKDWIEEDFPSSARTGLLHLLKDAVDKDHLSDWSVVAKELRRIARVSPHVYSSSIQSIEQARRDAEVYLNQVDWEKVYDFCERLYSHLAHEVYDRNSEMVTITKAQSQLFFAEELQ